MKQIITRQRRGWFMLVLAGVVAGPALAQSGIDNMRLLGRNEAEFAHMMDFLVVGDYAYASVGLGSGLQTYDLSDPANVERLDSTGFPGWRAYASGDTLFNFLHDRGVQMYSIAGGIPSLLGSYNPGGLTSYEGGIRVGDFLYVAAHHEGIHRLDLTLSTAPDYWDQFALPQNACWDVVARDGHLFVANGRHGLSVVALAGLEEIAALDLPGLANDIVFSEDEQTVFLTLAGGGVAAVDVSDPAQPLLASQAETLGNAFSMDRVGDILVTGSYPYAERFDVSDPAAIERAGWDATKVYAMGAGAGVNSQGDTLLVIADWRGLGVYGPEPDPTGDIEVYPFRLDFGVTGAPKDTTVRVRNNGAGPLTVTSIQTPGGIVAAPTSFTLGPGETQGVVLTAQPQQVWGHVLYSSDDPDESVFTQLTYANNTSFPQIGSMGHDFTLLGTDGQYHTLSDYRGKVVFLQFGADW